MSLKASSSELSEKIKVRLSGAKDFDRAWDEVCEILLSHIADNASVTGSTANGGPLIDGKII